MSAPEHRERDAQGAQHTAVHHGDGQYQGARGRGEGGEHAPGPATPPRASTGYVTTRGRVPAGAVGPPPPSASRVASSARNHDAARRTNTAPPGTVVADPAAAAIAAADSGPPTRARSRVAASTASAARRVSGAGTTSDQGARCSGATRSRVAPDANATSTGPARRPARPARPPV
ncbi:hypothetical protein [Actinoalloteichus caeruleus]|uniref:hypothetical protein n=1 Tax=Actinoalloteichus cyanogriseus TaxID=2893586 RepID=UPI0020A258D5|nr:hypothetical protein [Actinoalloteichus caeruleus]